MGRPELNLHVDEELLAKAQAVGVPAEAVAEQALRQALAAADPAGAEARAAQWAEESAEAIQDYNRRIRERGVFSDGRRTW